MSREDEIMWLIIGLQSEREQIDEQIDALTLEWQGIKANEFVQKQADATQEENDEKVADSSDYP